MEEIDKLYTETDYLKNELGNIRAKYDFDMIDKNKVRLEKLDLWGNKMLAVQSKVSGVFESYFNCGLCSSLATVSAVVVEPCNHMFCKACYDNQGAHTFCRICGTEKETEYTSLMISEFLREYETMKKELIGVLNQFADIQGGG